MQCQGCLTPDILQIQRLSESSRIFQVKSSDDTRRDLLRTLKEIQGILEKDGNFLFYYIGHNSKEKRGFKLENNDNEDDIFAHDFLKKELNKVKSKYKLFILDTCYAGGVPLKEGDNEDASSLFGDIALGGEEGEGVKIRWFSSAPTEKSWLGTEIGYFTGAIRDVLTNLGCDKDECSSLRQKYSPGSLVPIDQLHHCVEAHLTNQMPGYECNKGEEGVNSFPGFPLKKGSTRPVAMGEPFVTDCTVALLMSGWGNPNVDLPAIKRNRENIEKILLENCKMGKNNLFTVESSGATLGELLKKLTNIKNILQEKEGNFLFYFTGHNWPKKKALQISSGTGGDFLEYKDLKEKLSEVKSKYKLFILDTCESGAVALKEDEEMLPLFWDVALGDEDDETKVQWYSCAKGQYATIGYDLGFTASIKEVLSDPNCQLEKCIDLRKVVPSGGMARVEQIHPCVVDHVKFQTPQLKCSKGENSKNFPAFARLT